MNSKAQWNEYQLNVNIMQQLTYLNIKDSLIYFKIVQNLQANKNSMSVKAINN